MKTKVQKLFLVLAMMSAVQAAVAQVNYAVSGNTAYVTNSPNATGNIVIDPTYAGHPVTSIGAGAFLEAPVTSVTIGTNVTSIGADAFELCTMLTNVTIPDSVTNIGNGAFDLCYLLTSATINNGVIGQGAFQQTGLTNVTIGSGVISIGQNAFAACLALTSATIGSGAIGFQGFSGDSALINVTIGSGVASIGDLGFYSCDNLTNLLFQGNAPSLGGPNVFAGVNASAVVYYYATATGWGATYGGLPTVELSSSPQIVADSGGVQLGNFGFTVTGSSNQVVVIDASTNLVNWQPIQTNTLTGSSFNFTDSKWTNYPRRFYRLTVP